MLVYQRVNCVVQKKNIWFMSLGLPSGNQTGLEKHPIGSMIFPLCRFSSGISQPWLANIPWISPQKIFHQKAHDTMNPHVWTFFPWCALFSHQRPLSPALPDSRAVQLPQIRPLPNGRLRQAFWMGKLRKFMKKHGNSMGKSICKCGEWSIATFDYQRLWFSSDVFFGLAAGFFVG